MKDHFYITLPSNSSMKFYPDNTTARYTTQLPRQIDLIGEWEVGLAEIQYPATFQTIVKGRNSIRLHTQRTSQHTLRDVASIIAGEVTATATFAVPPGSYTDITSTVEVLNAIEGLNLHLRFDRAGDRLVVRKVCECLARHHLSFSPRLHRHLGFEKMTDVIEEGLEAGHPPMLGTEMPAQMFVYSDIVEPRIVGDVSAPLLRIIQTSEKNFRFAATECKTLSPIHYLPLLLSNFNTIQIDIRDHLGEVVPFSGGTLTVTLHFKRMH